MERCNFGDNIVKHISEWRADVLRERSQRDFRYQLESVGSTDSTYKKPQTYIEMLEEGFKEGIRIIRGENQVWNERQNERKEAINRFVENYQSVKKVYNGLYHALVNYQEYQKAIGQDNVSVETLRQISEYLPQLRKDLPEAVKQLPESAKGDIREFLNEKIVKMNAAKASMENFNEAKTFGPYSGATLDSMKLLSESTKKSAEGLLKSLEKSGITNLQAINQHLEDLSRQIEQKVKLKLLEEKKQFDWLSDTVRHVHDCLKEPLQSYNKCSEKLSCSQRTYGLAHLKT